jgi:ferritin-like metal-binding protein YciE
VERIEKVFSMLDKTPRAKKCEALEGLSKEGDHVMEEAEDDGVLDAGLIASAQAVEHYEIARYGTLIAWAKQLDMADAADLLEETLAEEKAADEKLTGLAEEINPMAQRAEAA